MKRFMSRFSAVCIGVGMLIPTLSNVIHVNAESEKGNSAAIVYDTEKFDAKEFFVYVGTYGDGLPQFRYLYPESDGSYTADKVIWENAPTDIAYGDIFVANGEINLTKVYPAANDPVYAHAYHYTIDENAVLNKSGNCSDIMEKRNLTVTSKTYDGSSHWSIRYKDEAGTEYYYGLSVLASVLEVDPLDYEEGDVCTFALYNGNMVVPLPKQNIEENPVTTMGDVNGDSEFNIADAVLLQKWLLGSPDTQLTNLKAADFCKDNRLDVFDLCLMKRDLLEKTNNSDSIDTFELIPTESGVDEFIAQYSVPQSEYENDELYNITPQEITDKYGFRIFKYSQNCETFLEYNSNVYILGTGFGGNGTTSFAVTDLNNDENIEIYFTYSWGSGMHYSQVGYFDTATLKEIDFDYSSWDDMVLTANNGHLEAYTADWNIKNFVYIEATPKDKVGEISVENGNIVFNTVSEN
ncbi:MAG: dockerin type I repeat-containing protein [Ruminococcus sp.]|nr:dockerin type I repeat-containing protein [Ruminococcus sp.]